MAWSEWLPVVVSLGAAFTVMLLLKMAFKTAFTILRLVFFLLLAAAIYLAIFDPDDLPFQLPGTAPHAIGTHSTAH